MKSIEKIEKGIFNLTDAEILGLLNIENNSEAYYRLLYISDKLSREKFKLKGYVFTQIGINAQPCSVNCGFCSMGAGHYALDSEWEKDVNELKLEVKRAQSFGIDDLFLMATADYPIEKFLDISEKIKPLLKADQRFVANIADFNDETAKELKSVGYTGIYHINRLREGIDTLANPLEREETIEAAKKADLELYYFIEPIGEG